MEPLGVAVLVDDARKIGRDIDEGFVARTEIAATLSGFMKRSDFVVLGNAAPPHRAGSAGFACRATG